MNHSRAQICRQYILHIATWEIRIDCIHRLAQARTGTGKTLAFLIPLLQNIINVDPTLEHRQSGRRIGSASDIRAIIISPTRELAEQIAVEAKKVTRNTGVIVQTAVGGSQKAVGMRQIINEGCHILVGTPGRLNDILSDPFSKVRAPNLSAFVLDEADRLLDQGFAPEIKAIQDLLPDRRKMDRQTLLYSATVPREVLEVVRRTMKPDFQYVRTVQEGEQQTHAKVSQKLVNVGGFENLLPALVELCKRGINEAGGTDSTTMPFKAIVYFGATADVTLASAVFHNLKTPGQSSYGQHPLQPAKIIEMHARLTQQQRTRAADSFRRANTAIMLSSDVTARGMDFPNVTHVIQVGVPPSQEQYVHRIGRTARGDKTGEGWILVTEFESQEVKRRLRSMPLKTDHSLETTKVDMRADAQLPEHTAQTLTQVQDATKMVPRSLKAASYAAALGVYQWMTNKQELLDAMNDRATYGWGMEQPPFVAPGLAAKLGLSRLRGIQLGHEQDNDARAGGREGGFGGRASGGSRGGYGGGYDGGRSSPRGFGGGPGDGGRSNYRDDGGRGPSSDRADRFMGGKSSFGGRSPGGESRGGDRGGYSRHGGSDRGDYLGGGGFGRKDNGRESRYSQ